MTTMQINSHSFDRMNIRLSGREKAQVINAIIPMVLLSY